MRVFLNTEESFFCYTFLFFKARITRLKINENLLEKPKSNGQEVLVAYLS